MKQAIWVALLGAWILAAGSAYAEEVRLGYVDVRRVMTESKTLAGARGEIEKAIQERRQSLDQDERALRDMQQAYEKDKLLLSDSQKQAKQKEFEEKARAFQQARLEAQRELEQRERQFASKAIPKIRAIIGELAKERKLTLVFEKKEMPVLYAADGPDLTEEVIKRFDAKGGG